MDPSRWNQLTPSEREHVSLMVVSLREFAYAFDQADALSEHLPDGAPSRRFYQNALYQYFCNYFLDKNSRMRPLLDKLDCGDLVEPIDEMMDREIGPLTVREVVCEWRNKMLVHPSFSFKHFRRTVLSKIDFTEEWSASEYATCVTEAFARTKGLYAALIIRYPEALVGETTAADIEVLESIPDVSSLAEVHFHEQTYASVYLETDCTGVGEKFAEIANVAAFAIRQLFNLHGHPTAEQLASALSAPERILAEHFSKGEFSGVRIGPYLGVKGRKRFGSQLHVIEGRATYSAKAKGLGWFSRGAGYYAPMAVFSLLRCLADRRASDFHFLEWLLATCRGISEIASASGVTFRNQAQVALDVTFAAHQAGRQPSAS